MCSLCFTNVQHDKFYVNYNTFYSTIPKIRVKLSLIKRKSKIII